MGWGRSYLELGELRQDVGSKHLPMKDLIIANNVQRLAYRKVLGKRKGTTRTAMTFSGGSLSGAPEVILPGVNGDNYMRDTGGQSWIKSGMNWQLKSTQTIRPWVDTRVTNPADYTQPRPNACLIGNYIWQFAVGSGSYKITIVDGNTSRVSTAPFSVAATAIINLAPVWNGTDLWVFWTDNSATLKCHKFAGGAITSTPTATNYNTAGGKIQLVDAKYMSGVGRTLVIFGGIDTISSAYSNHEFIKVSYLDPATGASSAAIPAVVSWLRTDTPRYAVGLSGLTIAAGQEAFTSNFQYFAVSDITSGADQQIWLGRGQITPSNLSGTFASQGKNFRTSLSAVARFSATISAIAYVDTLGGNAVAYVSLFDELGSSFFNGLCKVEFFTGGGTPSQRWFALQDGWVASAPVLYGGVWYFVTGFDDSADASVTTPVQQGYFLRKHSDGAIVAQFLMGQGGARGHRNSMVIATTDVNIGHNALNVPNLIAYNGKLFATVAQTINVGFVSVSLAKIELQKSYGKPVQAMGYGFIPGNIPQVWGVNGAHEIAPLVAPPWIRSAGSGTASIAVRYVIREDDGTLWRSAPKVMNSVTGSGVTIDFPKMSHALGPTRVQAEIYAAASGPPKLQATIDCTWDPTLPGIAQYAIPATLLDGESLDTYGGGLEQTWPLQCQAVGYWRNRVFLAQGNKLFCSKELEDGLGPLFNETLLSVWSDSQLDINAMSMINHDYMALFAQDRIGVIGGAGPDGLGRGSYTIQTLSTRMGLLMSSCGAVGSGPDGSYFQDAATSRLCLITPSLQAVECGNGAYGYVANIICSIVHLEAQRSMLFTYYSTLNGGTSFSIVVDYGNRTEASPYGQNYRSGMIGVTVSSSCVDASGVAFIDSDGAIRRFGDNYYDESATGNQNYALVVSTGLVNPSGVQAEHLLSLVQVLLAYYANSTAQISVIVDGYATTQKDFSVTTSASQFGIRPTGAGRMQYAQIIITEVSPTNQGFSIEGIAMEYYLRGRPKMLNSGSVL